MNKVKTRKKKYTILFISSYCNYFIKNYGNFYRMYNNLIYFHNHKDFNVIVLQPDKERKQEDISLKKNIKCYYYRKFHFLRTDYFIYNDFNPFYILKVFKILRKHRIDLIHVEFPYGLICLKFITKTPLSYNSYNIEWIYAKHIGEFIYSKKIFRFLHSHYIYLLEKIALKCVKNVTAFTNYDKKEFIEIYGTSKEKIIVTSFGFIKDIFNNPIKKEIARKRLGINTDKFVVIFHGSFFMEANIEALNIIKDKIAVQIRDENVLFLIAGISLPPYKNTRNLRFLGYVEDLREFLYSADVAIVPILRGSGINTKVLEYISALIPVISTRLGSEGLSLENGVHGYIDIRSIDGMIKGILELKNNPEKLKNFKNNIRNLIITKYDWEEILKTIANRYLEILMT